MNFNLRKWRNDDFDSLIKYANNKNVSRFLCHMPYPYNAEAAHKFLSSAVLNEGKNLFCISVNDEAVGGIGLHPKEGIYCKNAEIGYWLGEPFWSKGIVSKAIKQVVEYGFKNFEINRIYASVFETNIASAKVLEKAGFEIETKFQNTLFKDNTFSNEIILAIRK